MTVEKILEAFELATGRPARKTGPKTWRLVCPGHDDHEPSLDLKVSGDRVLLVCRARGCHRDLERLLAPTKLRPADLFLGNGRSRDRVTVAGLAAAKHLPVEFLHQLGVEDGPDHVVISYRLRDGSPAPRHRRRSALRAKDGSSWLGTTKDGPIVPYGLDHLDLAVERGELILVEGESDVWAALFHNVPALGIPGASMAKVLEADHLCGIERLYVAQEPDAAGATFVAGITARLRELRWQGQAFALRLPVKDLADLHVEHGDHFADVLASAQAQATPAASVGQESMPPRTTAEPELVREGFDLALVWPDGTRFALTAIRDGREGVRGELTVSDATRRLHWGAFALSSTSARETLRKKLEVIAPGQTWGDYLEEVAWTFTQAAREGEPLVELTGAAPSPTRELLPHFLYEGEPTLVFGDGDTGKSLFAVAIAVAVQAGITLPFGLKPAAAVPVAYLDWETSRDTTEGRLTLLAAGLGIEPPRVAYKRMMRPLVDEVVALAAEFARRGIRLVIVDSHMFAVAAGDGAAFHEPITSFYNALRLFAPAASLVLSHVTGADARQSGPARPFGGAFAFNGPRLIWEAKRDPDVTDATAIAFTCRKANNLPRRPDPFGLTFQPGEGTITVAPLDLAEAPSRVVAGASMSFHVRLALARGVEDPEIIVKDLAAIGKKTTVDTIKRLVRLERQKAREQSS